MARTHVLIDTSIFLHILRVSGYENPTQEANIAKCMKHLLESGAVLYLPLTTILETGNHIGHIPNGEKRRQAAQHFVNRIQEALDGNAPWHVAPFVDEEALKTCLADFETYATQKLGLGDMLLIENAARRLTEFAQARGEEVCIWTLDEALRAHSPYPCPPPCR